MEEKDAQIIIALSFGQGRSGTPGASNEALARVVASLDEKYNLPIVAQWEIADCIPERMASPLDLVVRNHRQAGEYLDTVEVLVQAKEHCQNSGFTKVVIVAHPDHLPRAMAMAQKLGLETVAADTKKVPYDPDSVQEWTRSRQSFLAWNELALRLFLKFSIPLKDTKIDGVMKTSVIGMPATGDLNGDGIADYAFAFSQESGGNKFYYLVAGISDPETFAIQETNWVFAGKNINCQGIAIGRGAIEIGCGGMAGYYSVIGKVLQKENRK